MRVLSAWSSVRSFIERFANNQKVGVKTSISTIVQQLLRPASLNSDSEPSSAAVLPSECYPSVLSFDEARS